MTVDMAKVTARRYGVTHKLLQFLHLRKAPLVSPGPDQLVVNTDLEDATRGIRNKRDRAKLLSERGQEFLGGPAGPEQPAAKPTISDGNIRRRRDDAAPNLY